MILSSEISIYFILIQTLYLRSASGGGGVIIAIWKYIRLQLFVVEFASNARGTVFLDASFTEYRRVLVAFYKISLGIHTPKRPSPKSRAHGNVRHRFKYYYRNKNGKLIYASYCNIVRPAVIQKAFPFCVIF